MEELKELRKMILGLDELIGYWFAGYNASLLSAGGEDVYKQADYYRNKALKIIKKLEEKG